MQFLFKIFALLMLFALAQGQEKRMKCNGQEMKLSEEQLMNKKECLKEAKVESASELTKETTPCFIKCVFVKAGLVDDKGMPHKENIMKDLDKFVPEEAKKDLSDKIGACLDSTSSKIDPNESSCQSYIPLGECIHTAFTEVCKS